MTKETNKPSYLTVLGVLMIAAMPILGIVFYAFSASFLGENLLESADGDATILGMVVNYMPLVVGIGLIIYDLMFRRTSSKRSDLSSLARVFLIAGLVAVVVGLIGSFTSGADVNIGGGILFLFGLMLAVVGTVFVIAAKLTDKSTKKK